MLRFDKFHKNFHKNFSLKRNFEISVGLGRSIIGPTVDQIGTANHMISDKIRIDAKALRLLS
jgi:hypothetical protein